MSSVTLNNLYNLLAWLIPSIVIVAAIGVAVLMEVIGNAKRRSEQERLGRIWEEQERRIREKEYYP